MTLVAQVRGLTAAPVSPRSLGKTPTTLLFTFFILKAGTQTNYPNLREEALYRSNGRLGRPRPNITGNPDTICVSGIECYVSGMGTLARSQPQVNIYMPSASQFNSKISAHEQVHVNQYTQAGGVLYSLWRPADYYANYLANLTDTTGQGLNTQIANALINYNAVELVALSILDPAAEAEAYQVSDPIAPMYVYQSACTNQP